MGVVGRRRALVFHMPMTTIAMKYQIQTILFKIHPPSLDPPRCAAKAARIMIDFRVNRLGLEFEQWPAVRAAAERQLGEGLQVGPRLNKMLLQC